jgi:hypothetical protein
MAMDCGELVALSVAWKVVEAAPAAVGLKASVRVQLAPAASEVPQVLVEMTNSLALPPVNLKELTAIGLVPVFLKVTVSLVDVEPTAVLGKVTLVGEKAAVDAVGVEPVKAMLCGELVALSVAVRVAVAEPVAVGLKARVRVQLTPAAREVLQVLPTMENSAALAPVNLKELTEMAA